MSIEQIAMKSMLQAIGNTPIVCLNGLSPKLSVNLYGKCEFLNPGGSIKDRIALYIVNQAEKNGQLKPQGTIVEATSGNTGLGLALVAAFRGYKCIFVMGDKQSEEKRRSLKALGAQVIITPSDVAPKDPRSYYMVAERIAKETPNSFYASQYTNQDNPMAHYLSTGPEIWRDCGHSLHYLILGIGTGGTVTGITKYIKEKNPAFKSIGVDPVGSLYHELFHTGKLIEASSYLVEGIGEDFVPSTIDLSLMDDVIQVTDEESFIMARRLVKEFGILAGGSSGSAVAGAIKYFLKNPQKEFPKKNALIILCDSYNRYLNKYLNDDWMIEKGFLI